MDQLLSQGPLFLICLLFMMGIVVTIHELGHYYAGRRFNAAVESFSFGFGQPIWETRDRNGTRWRINWLLFGGFVAFQAKPADIPLGAHPMPSGRPFESLSPYERIVVSLAGPLANFVLAAFIFSLILAVRGVPEHSVMIDRVVAGSPAERAGLQAGDHVKAVNGRPVTNVNDVSVQILLNPNTQMTFDIARNGLTETLSATPEEKVRANDVGQMVRQATLGIILTPFESGGMVRYGPLAAVAGGIAQTGETIGQTVTMLSRIVTGKMSIHTMSGPVGIGDVSRRVVGLVWEQDQLSRWERIERLFWVLLSLCAAISVGVGFFNLLPLPVLDGGRIVFDAYEAVTGSQMPEKIQNVALNLGVFLLIAMVVVITWGDIIEAGVFGRGGA